MSSQDDKIVSTQKGVPSSQEKKGIIAQFASVHSFSSPLPPPDHLEVYEKLLPGVTDRILTMAEKQSDERIKLENKMVDASIRHARNGMLIGCISMFLLIALGAYLAIKGLVVLAGIILTTTLLGVLAIFVLGQVPSNKSR